MMKNMWRKLIFIVVTGYIAVTGCMRMDKPAFSPEKASLALDRAASQNLCMARQLPDSLLPRSIDEGGKLVTSRSNWWCCGFYPGSLWFLYEHKRDEAFLKEAVKRTALVENVKDNRKTHDVGFMLYSSFGNGYRITGNESYKEVMLTGANSLISRYNPVVGMIRSWDHGKWKYPVIIDNMMNLEFLFWATRVSGDSTYYKIALNHADNTIRHHFREDYSTYHVVDFDPETGQVIQKTTHQGFSAESAWARGQSWSLYGFTVLFRETGEKRFLDQAVHVAGFILNHPRLPDDKIPYWDYDSPDIPDTKRDASAAAIMASAFLELQEYVEPELSMRYRKAAERILSTLVSPEYMAKEGENGCFIIKHCVGSMPGKSEVDVPLTYADYYFIEALLRYLKIAQNG